MILSPQMIQSMELLQLPALDLLEIIKQELDQNPVLELQEDMEVPESRTEEPLEFQEIDELPERSEEEAIYPRKGFEQLEIYEDEWREQFTQYTSRHSDDTDSKRDFLQNTAARPMSLSDIVFEQFGLIEKPSGVAEAGKHIIYNLDENGYLRYSLEELVEAAVGTITLEDAREALRLVQNLEPKGLGARTTKECLLLQLSPDDPALQKKKELIEKHLDDIGRNKLPKIASEMGISIEELKNLIFEITSLNPRPGATLVSEKVPYIVPDVTVNNVDGEHVVQIESSHLPRLSINTLFNDVIKSKNVPADFKQFIHEKMDLAKWLIRAIEQRRRTLHRIAAEIVRVQKDFLDHGIHHLKPLRLKQIAEDLDIAVSTVSRAINNKYIQTPRGIFPMKFFFSTEVGTTGARHRPDGNLKLTAHLR